MLALDSDSSTTQLNSGAPFATPDSDRTECSDNSAVDEKMSTAERPCGSFEDFTFGRDKIFQSVESPPPSEPEPLKDNLDWDPYGFAGKMDTKKKKKAKSSSRVIEQLEQEECKNN